MQKNFRTVGSGCFSYFKINDFSRNLINALYRKNLLC